MIKLDFLEKDYTETNNFEEEEIKNMNLELKGNVIQLPPKFNVIFFILIFFRIQVLNNNYNI